MVSINGAPIFLISLVAWGIYRFLVFKHAGSLHVLREIVVNLFFFYGCAVFSYTFFPMDIGLYGFGLYKVNLIPLVQTFRYLSHLENPLVIRNLLGNLALLAPLGIFLPLLFRKLQSFSAVIGVGFLVTLGIEIFQLPLRFRVFDIDDLIINTLGVALGYGVFRLAQLLPFVRRRMDQVADAKRAGRQGYFIGFVGIVLAAFFVIFYLTVIYNVETSETILEKLPQQEQQLLESFRFGEYLCVFSESVDGDKNFYVYRQVIFDRYTLISTWENLDLQLEEYIIRGDNAFSGKNIDYFAIARSESLIAVMMSGDRRFLVSSFGDYYFSYARLPLDQWDAYFSFRFMDADGNNLSMRQDP